jgi:hypothetical protein
MRVLLAEANEKHCSYSACKTNVMIIDGTAATLFDKDEKFIPSTTNKRWHYHRLTPWYRSTIIQILGHRT